MFLYIKNSPARSSAALAKTIRNLGEPFGAPGSLNATFLFDNVRASVVGQRQGTYPFGKSCEYKVELNTPFGHPLLFFLLVSKHQSLTMSFDRRSIKSTCVAH